MKLLSDVLDRRRATAPTHVVGKALGVGRIVCQEVQLFALHLAAAPAIHASHFHFQVDAQVAASQVPDPSLASVVPTPVYSTTRPTTRFFERRRSVITRALGSPKTPRTVGSGRNPGKAYASQSRRFRFVDLAIET